MKKFAAFSMAAVMLTGCFVGCGSKSSDKEDKYTGKWEVSKAVYGSQEFKGSDEQFGQLLATQLQFELKSDGTAVGWNSNTQKEEEDKAEWSVDGDKLTLKEDGEEVFTFDVKGDTLVYSESEGDEKIEMTLSKVSEYSTNPASTGDEEE